MSDFEVIVLGGGSAGLGVAQQAAVAGFRTLLLERGQLAGATSDNSLRIMHGGLRYLQTLDLPRICESIRDQAYWLERVPHLVKKLPCLMPLQRWGLKSSYSLRTAGFSYELLYRLWGGGARTRTAIWHAAKLKQTLPFFASQAPYGAFYWEDALISDQLALAAEIAAEIRRDGGLITEGARARAVRRSGLEWVVDFEQAGQRASVSTRVLVNALGPWLVEPLRPPGAPANKIQWCRAFNIVLNKGVEKNYALGVAAAAGRYYFLVPREHLSVLGTFYLALVGSPDDLAISPVEVVAALQDFNRACPELGVNESDIGRIEAGVLPLKGFKRGEADLYGSAIVSDYNGYIEVLSTKYSTFRSQGARVLQKARPYLV